MFKISKKERTGRIAHVGSLMKAIIQTYNLARPFSISALRESWPEIAGPAASLTQPGEIKHDILYVLVEHSAAANEIIMRKGVIMERFTKAFGENIKDVRTVICRGIKTTGRF